MIQYISWKIISEWWSTFIINDFFWLEVLYSWEKSEWNFFLQPIIDSNHWTINYYAFDNIFKRNFFNTVLKISWIWWKTAFFLSWLNHEDIKKAIDEFDLKYFQKLPWIWPKTAKRLLLELKSKINDKDISKLNIDDALLKNIIKTLKPYWFDQNKIKLKLESCDIKLSKENMEDILKRIFENYEW